MNLTRTARSLGARLRTWAGQSTQRGQLSGCGACGCHRRGVTPNSQELAPLAVRSPEGPSVEDKSEHARRGRRARRHGVRRVTSHWPA
eukprot:CAMPEP_0185200154 /NCGR_PEP_ID=MMETSP1140-20130426/46628_1 /TAXON_ID=298111 /ORGANISM="Pavlova sp., Strain CCMP459" /LENGTH=87 /DNA_ID=CAMNT_0027767465 /DNA_START=1 /DNA_END=260 /DNA_ORIENTATION=-